MSEAGEDFDLFYYMELTQLTQRVIYDHQDAFGDIEFVSIACLHRTEDAGSDGKWQGGMGSSSKSTSRCFSVNTVDLTDGKRNLYYMMSKLITPNGSHDFHLQFASRYMRSTIT